MEMVLTAGMISGEEAKENGLVNYCVEQGELMSIVALAKKMKGMLRLHFQQL